MTGTLHQHYIDEILTTQRFGRLVCIFNDQPYIIPITYVYYNGYIYGQTNEGTKLEILRLNKNVCFEISGLTDMQRQSVVINGEFEELHNEEAAIGRKIFLERAFPLIDTYPTTANVMTNLAYPENIRIVKSVIYRIRFRSKVGYKEVTAKETE